MDSKSMFNAVVCIIGIAIFLIHVIDIALKREKRKEEISLLLFIVFTSIHFALYLTFTLLKPNVVSDSFIIGFYTTFYAFNNVQVLLLFIYALIYVKINYKAKNELLIFNLIVFTAYMALIVVNIYTHIYFDAVGGVYVRSKYMLVSQGYQFVTFASVFFLTLFNKKLPISEKIAFGTYCLLPFVAIIVQNTLPGYAIAYLSIIVSVEILFLFVNTRKDILLAKEAKKNKEIEVKIMMSQIQPHFIYNTLASISTLIEIDPNKAQKALDDFTEYLRVNLSSLSDTGLIPFKDELKHIQTYLSLEKMRFENRLNINYEIKSSDFLVPPLSVQPIVENAVKHGILKNVEGGNITIKAYEKGGSYIVEVIDDGVGFDPGEIDKKDKMHIGINNVRSRLAAMCDGSIKIDSRKNIGTKVTITFKK